MRRHWIAAAVLATCVAPAGLGADSGPPELVVIVHRDNSANPSGNELESLFLRKEPHWPNGEAVIPVNSPPDSEARREFDRVVLGMSSEEVARYWLAQRIRSGVSAPREVGDPVLAVKLVARFKGAIAYVPAGQGLDGVRAVAQIRGGKIVSP